MPWLLLAWQGRHIGRRFRLSLLFDWKIRLYLVDAGSILPRQWQALESAWLVQGKLLLEILPEDKPRVRALTAARCRFRIRARARLGNQDITGEVREKHKHRHCFRIAIEAEAQGLLAGRPAFGSPQFTSLKLVRLKWHLHLYQESQTKSELCTAKRRKVMRGNT